jgi:hypothetical protein
VLRVSGVDTDKRLGNHSAGMKLYHPEILNQTGVNRRERKRN